MANPRSDRRAAFLLMASAAAFVLFAGWSTDWSFAVRFDVDMEKRLRRDTGQRGDDIQVTAAPFQFPGYFFDVSVGVGERTDLIGLVPEAAFAHGLIGGGTALRVRLGEEGKPASATFSWNTKAKDFALEIYDGMNRPVGGWSGSSGATEPLRLQGGVYRVMISSVQALGAAGALVAAVAAPGENHEGRLFGDYPRGDDIPNIQLMLSPSNRVKWERVRSSGERMLSKTGRPQDLPKGRINGRLLMDGGETQVSLSLAGEGFLGHVSAATPSFTVRVKAGPLVRGSNRFKLYSINSVSILDYAVSSVLADEGVLVPRQFLARVSLNHRDLGLYIFEEVPPNKSHFTALKRFDGQVFSVDKSYVDRPGSWPPKRPLTTGEKRSQAMLDALDAPAFARMLALGVRFHMSHGLQVGNLRFYRSALLENIQPWIRDINVDQWSSRELGLKSMMTHVDWWLNPTLFPRGPHRKPKFFPPLPDGPDPEDPYLTGPYTTGFSALNVIVNRFLSDPRHRVAFEQALVYYASPRINRRLQNRLKGMQRHLKADGQSGKQNDLIAAAVDFVSNDFTAARVARLVLGDPRLVVDIAEGGHSGHAKVTLVNAGATSLSLDLPDFVNGGAKAVLLPSPRYQSLVKEDFLLPQAIPTVEQLDARGLLRDLSPGEWRRFMALERYLGTVGGAGAILDLSVPRDNIGDLVAWLREPGHVRMADLEAAPATTVQLLETTAGKGPSGKQNNPPVDMVVWTMDAIPAAKERGTVIRYLVGNVSRQPLSIDPGALRVLDGNGKASLVRSVTARRLESGAFLPVAPGSIVLAPSRLETEWFSTRWFPYYWPAGPAPLLAGSLTGEARNVALVEVELEFCGSSHKTDPTGLAKGKIVVLEPFESLCPDRWPVAAPVGDLPKPVRTYTGHEVSPSQSLNRRAAKALAREMASGSVVDDDLATFWTPREGRDEDNWLGFEFSPALPLEAVKLVLAPEAVHAMGKGAQLKLQGSSVPPARGLWTKLASVSGTGSELTLSLKEATAFPHYRLIADDAHALSLREVRFVAKESVLPTPTRPLKDFISRGLFKVSAGSAPGERVVMPTRADLSIDEIVEIPAGVILRLPPGATLSFGADGGILSYGVIEALGSAEKPVSIGPGDADSGFVGVAVIGSRRAGLFHHVNFSGARGGFMGMHQISGGLSAYNTEIRISGGTYSGLKSIDGLHLAHTRFSITGAVFADTLSDAIDIDWGMGDISDSRFSGCGNPSGDCIDLSGSRVRLVNVDIRKATDKGVSIGEGSIVDLSGVTVEDSRTGVAVKDSSDARLRDCRLPHNQYGLISYIKQPYFTAPKVFEDGCEINNNGVDRHSDPRDVWTRRFD